MKEVQWDSHFINETIPDLFKRTTIFTQPRKNALIMPVATGLFSQLTSKRRDLNYQKSQGRETRRPARAMVHLGG